ncbi:chemotaxis protein CheD [Sorangium sp. So ce131]|uniref:chemotaxis protein CheD n=1 Tax=Sorangium sp. So ce131 TaxID=3133282 RepID=UPI003F5D5C54
MLKHSPAPRRAAVGQRLSVIPSGPQSHYLTAGNVFAASEPTTITTIVGSSVAICLWEPTLRVGGISHYLLPRCPDPELASGRFGDSAFALLLERLTALGASSRSFQARIVGGACMISAFRERASPLGQQNVDVGVALLRAAGIRIVQEDTGGGQGRKLVFRTDDGSTTVQPL